jgi:lysophospholipase L1-like esterase
MLIVFLGGSITEGLGVVRSRTSYANLLQAKLNSSYSESVQIINFGASAMQINESRRKYEEKIIELQPDIIVYAHGNTEAVVREQRKYLKFFPKRWRRPGWMDPRAYYSTRFTRRLIEKIESGLRWRVKVALIKVFGGKQWMSLEEFRQQTSDFIMTIFQHNTKTNIIFLTPGDIEEKYFPGSPESMRRYREVMKDIYEHNKSNNRLFMCDSSHALHKWNDYFYDRFHPNENGHNKIAEALLNTMIQHSLLRKNKVMKEVSR